MAAVRKDSHISDLARPGRDSEDSPTSDLRPLTTVVQARGLTKIYNQRSAVDGISFSVKRGETFGLLGPNGAGKSTTMRMIACRAPLTSGDLLVEYLDLRTPAPDLRSPLP